MSFMFGATFLIHLLISKKPVESLEVEEKFSKSVSQKNRENHLNFVLESWRLHNRNKCEMEETAVQS